MRLLAPLLCLMWAAVAHADAIDDAIAAAVVATPRQVLVVHFDHPLCPYSPATKTSLQEAQNMIKLHQDYLRVLTVDVTTTPGKALAVKYSVGGTPSLKLWVDAQNGPIDLPGGRTGLEIADAVLLHYGPAVKTAAGATLSDAERDFWTKHHPLTLLTGHASCSTAHQNVYKEFALTHRDKGVFLKIDAGTCEVVTFAPTQDAPVVWLLTHPAGALAGLSSDAVRELLNRLYPRLNRRVEPMGPRVYNRHVANDVAVCWLFEDLHLVDQVQIDARKVVHDRVRGLFDHDITNFNPFSKGQFAFVVTDLQTDLTKAKELGYTNQPGINIGCEFNGNSFFHHEAGPTMNVPAFTTAAENHATTWKLPDPTFAYTV